MNINTFVKALWKRKDIATLLFVCTVVAVAFLFLFFSNLNIDLTSVTNQTPDSDPTPIPFVTKTLEKTSISGVTMNDFLKGAKTIGQDRNVVVLEKSRYHIIYLPKFNKFLITVMWFPFTTTRLDAEKDFLEALGITQNDACRLSVAEIATKEVNRDIAGIEYPLSFCSK